jgi:HPt (histidine-containing phosphotransfer) domain-containing protein
MSGREYGTHFEGTFIMLANRREAISDVIDLDDLMTRCLGNLEFADRILTVFQSRFESDLSELEHAVQLGDVERVERIAHRLKGACANAAASGLAERATNLWNAAHEGQVKSVRECFSALQDEWSQDAAILQAVSG